MLSFEADAMPEKGISFQVHNTNLQQMTGWIPRFLANRTGWHLVLQGSHVWRPVELTRHVPRRRAWQIWARGDALLGAPLHSLAGDGQDAEFCAIPSEKVHFTVRVQEILFCHAT
ncbi:hypothetical protein AK812_SmicGene44 [Symbiodinium microadriaticum]|uniref:Uncharacterized protein n=1 Tax=Symbiodinium microadriaticum TaxID=2951 RepID=A0A1Q9F7R0_SYMMI|nr:hypothetical protein AK812_SmicGene44 [Symbiodinium microadriaticum]CAE7463219.1 unnamed protein product [Symbiodinium microadriaticum]